MDEDFPILRAGDVLKVFPDLKAGDVIKVSPSDLPHGFAFDDLDVGELLVLHEIPDDSPAIRLDRPVEEDVHLNAAVTARLAQIHADALTLEIVLPIPGEEE